MFFATFVNSLHNSMVLLLQKKKCFVANEVYFNILILLSRTARQIRIDTRPKFPGKCTAFDKDYKRAVEAFEKREANEPYLNPMPEAQSFKRGHFDIKEGQDVKVVRSLVEFVESWKGQQQQANGNACLCKELVDHCVQKTTFSQQFMEIFFKECAPETKKLAPKRDQGHVETKKSAPNPAPKRGRGEMTEMKKPPSKEVLGELAECSDNPTQTSFNAQEGSTMTSKIGVMKTENKADSATNSYNHTTNFHFHFHSPALPACDGALGLQVQIQNLQAREQFWQGVVGTYANCLQQNGISLPKIEIPANLQTQIIPFAGAPFECWAVGV